MSKEYLLTPRQWLRFFYHKWIVSRIEWTERVMAVVASHGPVTVISNRFREKAIAFFGDSITFGYDDTWRHHRLPMPWVEVVNQALRPKYTYNGGVISAHLLDTEGDKPYSVLRHYKEWDDRLDIVGVMIGINDAYRNAEGQTYPLEKFSIALRQLLRGLKTKYPATKGKQVFILIYPDTDLIADWGRWKQTMTDAADELGVKICDLNKAFPVKPADDIGYVYWQRRNDKKYAGKHSAHPTQEGAYKIGEYVAKWMEGMI